MGKIFCILEKKKNLTLESAFLVFFEDEDEKKEQRDATF